jgi:histidinol dehydrogenase
MFDIIKYPAPSQYNDICERPSLESNSLDTLIEDVYNHVKLQGDQALIDYTKQF